MESNLIQFVSVNTECISKKFSAEFKIRHNLTHHQNSLLWVLTNKDKMMMSEVAQSLRISKQQMTKLAENAVLKGLVKRSYNPKNKRQIYLSITPEGQELFDSVLKAFKENFEMELEKLSIEDQHRLLQAMDTMIELVPLLDFKIKHEEV